LAGDAEADQARLLRALEQAVCALAQGDWPVVVGPAGDLGQPGAGHFHLVPELFVQLAGHTDFQFPGQHLRLLPGQVLLLPPRLLHAERVADGPLGAPFANLVLQADGERLGCHLAHQVAPGQPGIAHLVALAHPQARHIHGWLADAAHLGHPALQAVAAPWLALQARGLVCAALAGTLHALLNLPAQAVAEPPLVTRLRVLVQNQLGDQGLSVRGLARQSGCTADHLSHVFARCTGEHLVAYINRLRLARAAQLLQDTPMAAKQVAWACGFASQSYFSRAFSQHHGMTPTAWRLAHA
jgi:AraC-like DNA-binding protein